MGDVGNIYTENRGGPPFGGIWVNGPLLPSLWDIIRQVTSANPISHTGSLHRHDQFLKFRSGQQCLRISIAHSVTKL